jgi:hypothetical protein
MTVPERQWDSMSPGEKQSWLLNQALDVKRDILTTPLPDPNDDSAEAHRMRALILAAADSTIEQTIRLRTGQLTPAANDDGMEKIFEERMRAAKEQIGTGLIRPLEFESRPLSGGWPHGENGRSLLKRDHSYIDSSRSFVLIEPYGPALSHTSDCDFNRRVWAIGKACS